MASIAPEVATLFTLSPNDVFSNTSLPVALLVIVSAKIVLASCNEPVPNSTNAPVAILPPALTTFCFSVFAAAIIAWSAISAVIGAVDFLTRSAIERAANFVATLVDCLPNILSNPNFSSAACAPPTTTANEVLSDSGNLAPSSVELIRLQKQGCALCTFRRNNCR